MPIVEEEAADKRTKRPPSKSHKKKAKPTDLQLNGHLSGPEKHAVPHDHSQHPPKKTKSSHKPSQSVSSQAAKRSPPHNNSHTKISHGHPPSPATTPPDLPEDFEIHNYSPGFLSRYNDQDIQIVHTNSFAGLQVSNTMSDWLRDPEKLQNEAGCAYADVFQKLPPNIESLSKPLDVVHTKKTLSPGTVLQWQCLRAPTTIEKDVPLMELNGEIGFQNIYCAHPENRWTEFSSPLPFVYFHPMLPVYIDTRKEGSEARFVRRSCKPNAVLDTYLSDSHEYHFWLVSDRHIAAKEQITIPWDFRFPKTARTRMLRLLGLSDEETGSPIEPPMDEGEYQHVATWLHLVLSEHGGCACNLGAECAFARFHRNYIGKVHVRSNPPKNKRRKSKAQHTISPTSTGHATTSRSASEGHLEEVPEHDHVSISGSSRSKPPSRDLTPTARQGSFDTLGILTEPTDRDKRKVTMIEDSFRRMEQQQQQHPPKKRKRVSDGGTAKGKGGKGGSATQTPNPPSGFPERHYVDAGTSRSKSGSPTSATSSRHDDTSPKTGSRHGSAPAPPRPIAVAPRAAYCDAAVQTEPEEGAWYKEASPTITPKRRIASLSKRLLYSRQRLRQEGKGQSSEPEALPVATTDVDSPTQRLPLGTPDSEKGRGPKNALELKATSDYHDIPMPDAPAVSPSTKTAESPATVSPIKTKTPDLRVQMPPVPAFGSPASAPSTASTPLSAGGSLVQSPFSASALPSPFAPPSVNGIAANPSPVKKKMSLSDYTKRNKAAASRPSVGTTLLKPVSGGSDEPRSAVSVDNHGALDSPVVEKIVEATASTTTTATTGTATAA